MRVWRIVGPTGQRGRLWELGRRAKERSGARPPLAGAPPCARRRPRLPGAPVRNVSAPLGAPRRETSVVGVLERRGVVIPVPESAEGLWVPRDPDRLL